MRKLKLGIIAVVLALSACATNLIGKETQALQAVNATLAVANANFAAGKMTKATHANVLLWAEAAKAGIDAAVKNGDAASLVAIKADADVGKIKIEDGSVK